ncbi:fucose permease [Salegentibacter sp. 24]|uniref:MFS transporter n=1 Tax=Salegentibacter sp. 24 TaxID=2183986 RepID=UPI00105C7A73|nr:MFS transporter [Salegentibacter sp. 24]TDN95021.1 fucose permease [Salegentibacter sp. 24]
MQRNRLRLNYLLPVLLSYIVMGFVDIVGVSTGYAQRDFNLSPEMAQLIPSMVFIWFFILSIPVAILQNNYGKRKILLVGIGFTAVGMFIPFIVYTYLSLLGCFVFLGIGNTIIQVASNPLLQDVVGKEKFSSFMSLSQFIKAISSLLGPIIVTYLVTGFGNWKLVFVIYGLTSLLTGLWLAVTPIEENNSTIRASFKSSLSLLKNPFVASMVLAIFLIVGLDVGMNTNIQNLLVQRYDISLEDASLGISIYFTALMISRLFGAILLARLNNYRFLFWSALLTVFFLILLIISPTSFIANSCIFLVGLSSGNLFPLIFSLTINKLPNRANEISGLMIMAVVGGAVIPPIMGLLNKAGGIALSFSLLIICSIYVFFTYFILKNRN